MPIADESPSTPKGKHAAGPIEIKLNSLSQLFFSLDPAPFRDRDLDPAAAAFIIDEAEDRPAKHPLTIVLHLPEADAAQAEFVSEAIRHYFALLRQSEQRVLRGIFRDGRWALFVGLITVVVIVAFEQIVSTLISKDSLLRGVIESMVILAWVVLWRPAELLLYDWWPVRRRILLLLRLESVNVQCSAVPASERGWGSVWGGGELNQRPPSAGERGTVDQRDLPARPRPGIADPTSQQPQQPASIATTKSS